MSDRVEERAKRNKAIIKNRQQISRTTSARRFNKLQYLLPAQE
jgi:hypothetical protein